MQRSLEKGRENTYSDMERLLLVTKNSFKLMISVRFRVWRDAPVWARCLLFLDVHVNNLEASVLFSSIQNPPQGAPSGAGAAAVA